MPVFVGTSGWQYRDWRGAFYPERLAQRSWLEHYSQRFQLVELNNSFYNLPKAEVFAQWARRTPEDFVMAPKFSRYLTHIKRLREPEEPVRRFLDHVQPLGRRLGPILLQLPPTLRADAGLLRDALAQFPPGVRVTVEFRHETWFTAGVEELLTQRQVALCLADRRSRPLAPLWRTTGWGYLRLHEGTATPRPCYGRAALASWARRLAEVYGPDDDVYVLFNNDPHGCAVRDARNFAAACRHVGLEPSRVPAAREIDVSRGP